MLRTRLLLLKEVEHAGMFSSPVIYYVCFIFLSELVTSLDPPPPPPTPISDKMTNTHTHTWALTHLLSRCAIWLMYFENTPGR